MANVNVSYDELVNVTHTLQATRAEIESKVADARAEIDRLISTGLFNDQAGQPFRAAYAEYVKGSHDALSALDWISSHVRQTSDALRNIDAQLDRYVK